MGANRLASVFSFLLLLASVQANGAAVFDVTKYGAKPDGKTDLSPALLKAFEEACRTAGAAKVLVPAGDYVLGKATLAGPCKGSIEFEVKGKLQAFKDTNKFKGEDDWVRFDNMDNFLLHGGGEFNGQGSTAWAINDCHKSSNCAKLPMSIRFNFIANAVVRDITSADSKNFHINVIGCKNLTFTNVKILAPAESLNTDGIHLGRSNGINITDSFISTGDDCISIGDGTQNLLVKNVVCGPGHGISVGSLGKYQKEDPVIGIRILNCTLQNTDNGVRIKTWPSSPSHGIASDMHFEDIIMKNVSNPIIVDQEYCPWGQCKLEKPSTVKISNISFKNIRGTSANKEAVTIACSKSLPCEEVEIGDIDLKYEGADGPATFACSNVKPKVSGKQNPAACSSPVATTPPKSA